MTALALPLAFPEARSCGGCTACCRILGVDELAKPSGVRCPFAGPTGCDDYAGRPASCRTYDCLWRAGILADEMQRPDRLGLMFDLRNDPGLGPRVVAWEVWAGAAVAAIGLLRRLAGSYRLAVNLVIGDGWTTTELRA